MEPKAVVGDVSTTPRWIATLTSPILLTGGYAWGITTGPSLVLALRQSFETGPSLKSGLTLLGSLSAILSLSMGVALERRRSSSAPLFGIWGFLASMLLSWLSSPTAVDMARIDLSRGVLGAGGFALFALAWGVPDVLRRLIPEDDPRADTSTPLEARTQLPLTAHWITGIGVLAAAAILALAWRSREIPRSLFSHALAALLAVLLISVASEIAVGRKEYISLPVSLRLRQAAVPLLFLGIILATGGITYWKFY